MLLSKEFSVPPTNKCIQLVISEDTRPFNILKGEATPGIQTATFLDLAELRTHMHLASNQFENVKLILNKLDEGFPMNAVVLLSGRTRRMELEVSDDMKCRDIKPLLGIFLEPSYLSFLSLKGKKVGDINVE